MPKDRLDAELLKTFEQFPRAGADEDLPPEVRFARNVMGLLSQRLVAKADEELGHSLFLLEASPPEDLIGAVTDHYAVDMGETRFADGAWFVSEEVVRARRVALPSEFDQMFEAVKEWGLSDTPAVAYRMTDSGPLVRYYPYGLGAAEGVFQLRLVSAPVTLTEILEIVDRVWHSTLRAPNSHRGETFWSDPATYEVDSRAELKVQSYVRCGLAAALGPGCDVEIEQDANAAGRLDIEILQRIGGPTSARQRRAVLELKIVRKFDAAGKRHVKDGVDQAYAYRTERGVIESALCCFDMRRPPHHDCFVHVRKDAATLDIVLRTWVLYPSAKAYRDATVAAAKADGGAQP